MEKLGIDQIKKVADLVLESAKVIDLMGRTKGMARFGHLMLLMDEVVALGDLKWDQVMAQFKDLDAEERVQLMEHFKQKFDLVDDRAETAVESLLGILVKLEGIYHEAAAAIAAFKKSA